MRKRIISVLLAGVLLASSLVACSSDSKKTAETGTAASGETATAPEKEEKKDASDLSGAPEISGLTVQSKTELSYAECFDVYQYNDGYQVIDIHGKDQYLLVPEGKEVPKNIGKMVVLKQPLKKIYLAATSAMALFCAAGAIDSIGFSGLEASGWYVDAAKEAMNAGKIEFAGKYNEPDYEKLLDRECDLAVESTMIMHSPKVKEMLEDLDIPVLVDYSSYESHPLGRTEWIKMYAAITGHEEEAAAFFDGQKAKLEALEDFKNTGKTVAYFYVSSSDTVIVRNLTDYIPKMIDIAGGVYAIKDLGKADTGSASVEISMEEFYGQASEADFLIYNSSIDAPLNSLNDLLGKSELFKDFKAVKEGNVWCTGKSLYQATDIVGELIGDINKMITGGNEKDMTFLYKVK